ncbi:LCP family protein [Plantibacter flavus]|uniref:LCP family protein n=1 Tax=Plantibacter flavus TaxID=150123 RepID=UPI0023785424|nr:LCP family protein [Plantibacter flavus]MDD9154109.1 LCP family protein [Plantibacter flavus]
MRRPDLPEAPVRPRAAHARRHGGGVSARVRRRRLIVGIAGGLVLALLGGVGALALRLQGNLSSEAIAAPTGRPTEPAQPGAPDPAINVLLLGSDSRDLAVGDYGEDTGTKRSDAMVLVHVSEGNSRIDAMQIPRDTLTDLSMCTDTGRGTPDDYGMVNGALNSGAACSVAAVQAMTGVPIDHFVELDFSGFQAIVNGMDGLAVCLPADMEDPYSNLALPAGAQVIDGTQALALARTRHAVGDGSDISRLGNQQMVMSAIVQRALSAEVLTRPDRLIRFLDAVTSSLTVDTALGDLASLTSLAHRVSQVPASAITFLTMPWTEAPSDANRVVPSDDAAIVFSSLATDVPVPIAGTADASPAEPVAPVEPVRVEAVSVLNGSQTNGVATATADRLTALGYTVASIGDAETDTPVTLLLARDSDAARATAASLAQELGITVVVSGEPGPDEEDVVLVIGDDFASLTPPAAPAPVEVESRNAAADLCG